MDLFASVSWEKTTFTEFSHDLRATASALAGQGWGSGWVVEGVSKVWSLWLTPVTLPIFNLARVLFH